MACLANKEAACAKDKYTTILPCLAPTACWWWSFVTLYRFVQECAKRGLLVMLDLHRLAAAKGIPELW